MKNPYKWLVTIFIAVIIGGLIDNYYKLEKAEIENQKIALQIKLLKAKINNDATRK